MKYRIVKNKFVIEPSVRLHFYSTLSEISLEPRFGFKYNISDKLRFKFACGLYSKNLLSTVSDRDVVNIFYGFLSAPESLPDEFNGTEVTSHLRKGRDAPAGLEIDFHSHLNSTVD